MRPCTLRTPWSAATALAPLLVMAAATSVGAVQVSLSLSLFNRGSYAHRHIEELLRYDDTVGAWAFDRYLRPLRNDLAYSVLAVAELDLHLTDTIEAFVSVDSGVFRPVGRRPAVIAYPGQLPAGITPPPIPTTRYNTGPTSDGADLESAALQNGFVREYGFRGDLGEGAFEFALGRIRHRVADGLIYDDWALGARVSLDLEALDGPPIVVDAYVAFPASGYDDLGAALVGWRVEWVWSVLEGIGLFGSVLVDDGGTATQDLLDPWFSDLAYVYRDRTDAAAVAALGTSIDGVESATLWWLGAHASRMFGDVLLIANAIVQGGELTLGPVDGSLVGALPDGMTTSPTSVATLGVAADLSARVLLTTQWSLEPFAFFVSGGENPLVDRSVGTSEPFGSYIAVRPHVTWTNLFFAGGLNASLTSRHGAASGVSGKGVIAAGLRADWALAPLSFEANAATIFAQHPSVHGGTFYGVEVDLEFRASINAWLSASVEYDIMVPGDFFGGGWPMHQVLLGLDVSWESSTIDALDDDIIP